VLHHGGSYSKYIPTGHILYVYQQTLFALPFDVRKLEVTGPPSPLVESLRASPVEGAAQYDISMNGTLIGMFGEAVSGNQTELVRLPLNGGPAEVLIEPMDLHGPAVSPEGRRVAYTIGSFADADVWVLDLARGTRTRLTFTEGKADWHPIWSPDGKSIAFSSGGGGSGNQQAAQVQVKAADGSGEQQRLSDERFLQAPEQWTPDGSTIIFAQNSAGSWGLWKTSATEKVEHEKVLDTPAFEISPRLSMDGRWLAYQSTESGRPEVYVRPYPGTGGKWQISTQGGQEPRWSRRGWELFYRTADSLFSVQVVPGESSIEVGRPVGRLRMTPGPGALAGTYDLMPDASAVIAAREVQRERDLAPLRRVRLTLNWFERLKPQMPAGEK
jgi:serine/threonine-protein kinase